MIGAVVLRPAPGAAVTITRLKAIGIDVHCRPLFTVTPVAWRAPDPTRFDALLLTSVNAVRHAGEQVDRLVGLPVLAVGKATAEAAQAAGLTVKLTGDRDVKALVTAARELGFDRLLHLAGRDRAAAPDVEAITIYESDAVPAPPGAAEMWRDRVALLHSARAARRFVELVDRDQVDRDRIAVAALSLAVLDAAGPGWAVTTVARRPTDAALVSRAAALIDPPDDEVDKQAR